jgi:hypothetical protein
MFCPNCGQENDDSVRHCKNCGTFIPDLSILGDDKPAANDASQQPMTYSALTPDQINDFQANAPRYQEYTMADVVAKKSHKKLITWLIVIATVLVLSVAAFFIVRWIITSVSLGKIKDDPTKYVLNAYKTSAQGVAASNDAAKLLCSSDATQRTVSTTISNNTMNQKTVVAVDAEAKKFYFMEDVQIPVQQGNKITMQSPKAIHTELYSTIDRGVAKVSSDGKAKDFYLDYNNLRQDALTSAFGPQGENMFHIDQKTYDTAMDVYEFVYNNLKQDQNPFGLMDLANTICADFDKCGNVAVSSEKADIDGSSVDAYVITHTFNNLDVVSTLVNDVKDWAKTNININEDVNKMLEDALAKVDVDSAIAQINAQGSLNNFELTIKHYVNKNNALMQTELILKSGSQGLKLTFCMGADPTNFTKIFLKAAIISGSGSEAEVQKITLTNDSTDAEEKYTMNLSGMALNGTNVFTRNKATGDFTVDTDITPPAGMGMGMTSGNIYDTAPEYSQPTAIKNSIKGNMTTSGDTVTITYEVPDPTGSLGDTKCEMSFSNKAEISELTSDNNLLKMSAKELTSGIF